MMWIVRLALRRPLSVAVMVLLMLVMGVLSFTLMNVDIFPAISLPVVMDPSILIDVPKVLAAYYSGRPDPSVPAQRVAFGTSGHRGCSLDNSFNETHILAISQAICLYRQQQGIDGPLYIVLVVRVHKLVPKPVWSRRYELINDFEKMLHENG